jgi:hypothetical protein
MANTQKSLNDALRAQYLERVHDYLSTEDEVLVVGANELAVPVVDADGNEKWIVLTVKVPTGSRDGDAYDGYAMAEDYRMRQTAKAEKAAERERKTAERQAKAKAKTQA